MNIDVVSRPGFAGVFLRAAKTQKCGTYTPETRTLIEVFDDYGNLGYSLYSNFNAHRTDTELRG
jgi:hypothetical protein